MPFKILSKKNATVNELAKAFAEIESMKADLEGQQQAAYTEMVRCQQQAMSSSSQKLDKAKSKYRDAELRVEAARDALDQLRSRIAAALPGHFRQQISELDKKHQALSRRRNELVSEWIALCARAAVIHEQLSGSGTIHLGNGEMRPGVPDPGFSYPALGHENQLFYLEKVREYRAQGDADRSVNMELDRIGNEIDKLEKTLESGDFAAEAEKVIESHRIEAQAAENAEAAAG